MNKREDLLEKLKSKPALVDGSRNDDAVNMAIIAYSDAEGEIDGSSKLFVKVMDLMRDEEIPTSSETDIEYLSDKCAVLMNYLPGWYRTGDIYAFAIV